MVSVTLTLFHKPAQEMNRENEPVTAAEVRELAKNLDARLQGAVDALEKLAADGWDATMLLYDIDLAHPDVETPAEARRRLKKLGLDVELFHIEEIEE